MCSSASANPHVWHAEARRLPDPVRERDVEHLHVHLADVVAHPFLWKTSIKKRPYCSAVTERPVTISFLHVTEAGLSTTSMHLALSTSASATRSMIGMS